MNPQITLVHEPFPHVIIKNLYDPNELKFIWREMEFLTSPKKLITGDKDGSRGISISGTNPSQNYSLSLDSVYPLRCISDILTITTKIASENILTRICELSPLIGHLKFCNTHTTKLKYYESGNFYRAHWDSARFTFLTYLFKEPKKFTGGDLHFDEYDYTIEIENNMVVFFVGSLLHSSTELKLDDNVEPWTGYGKYCIAQFVNYVDSQQLSNKP